MFEHPFKTLVFYKIYRSAFLSQRGCNTRCWFFKILIQWEDNIIYLT